MTQAHVIFKTDCQGQNSNKTISKSKLDVVRCWRVRKNWGVSCCHSSPRSLIFMYWFTLQIKHVPKQYHVSRTMHPGPVPASGLWTARWHDGLLSQRVSPPFPALGSISPPSVWQFTCKPGKDPRCIRPYYLAKRFPGRSGFWGVSWHNVRINPIKISRQEKMVPQVTCSLS